MRQTILDMVRLAQKPMLVLSFAGEEAQFASRGEDVHQTDRLECLGAVHVRVDATSRRLPQEGLTCTVSGCESDCHDGGDVQEGGQRGQSRVIQVAVQACDKWTRPTRRRCRILHHVRTNPCGFRQGFGRNARDRSMDFHRLAEESDVELCTHPWQPHVWRWDTHACQLCLLDGLAGKGFVGEACVIEHDPETPRLMFDNRKPMSKKAYLRCVKAAAGHFASWHDTP